MIEKWEQKCKTCYTSCWRNDGSKKKELSLKYYQHYFCVYTDPFININYLILLLALKNSLSFLAWILFELTKHKICLPITVTIALYLSLEKHNGIRGIMMEKEECKYKDL